MPLVNINFPAYRNFLKTYDYDTSMLNLFAPLAWDVSAPAKAPNARNPSWPCTSPSAGHLDDVWHMDMRHFESQEDLILTAREDSLFLETTFFVVENSCLFFGGKFLFLGYFM